MQRLRSGAGALPAAVRLPQRIFNTDGSLQSSELTAGALTNANFGKGVVTTVADPAILNGWGVRPYNWEYAASVQHELMPRVSV